MLEPRMILDEMVIMTLYNWNTTSQYITEVFLGKKNAGMCRDPLKRGQ